jgi:hypothetical protein
MSRGENIRDGLYVAGVASGGGGVSGGEGCRDTHHSPPTIMFRFPFRSLVLIMVRLIFSRNKRVNKENALLNQ